MDWQQIVSLIIVAAALVLLIRGKIEKQRKAKLRACGHDCGCEARSPVKAQMEALRLSGNKKLQ